MDKTNRYAQLDGLRGLAALTVLFHHYWPALARFDPSGGRLGVDLFFVLSGFLITRSLLQARLANPASAGPLLRRFHRRRIQRIFPVFYLSLAMVVLFLPSERTAALAWHAGFLSNWYFVMHGGFSGSGSHLWALAVEQQYYLLWPPVILWTPRRHVRAAVLSMILGGLLFRLLAGLYSWPDIVFDVVTPAAFEAMGCGALLYFSFDQTPRRGALAISLFGWGGLFFLLLGLLTKGTTWGPPAALLTTELSRALLLTWVIAQAVIGIPGLLGRALQSAFARALGAWSYSLYISHNFFLTYFYGHPHGLLATHARQVAAALLATLIWSILCYEFLEKPLQPPARQTPAKTL